MGQFHLSSVLRTSFSLPSFEIFLELMGPGKNPYAASIDFVDKVVFPVVPEFTYVLLIVFGAANLLTFFACFAVILVPLLRSRHFRKKHVWLLRTHYVDSILCPLYVPNAGLGVAIMQALANILFCIYSALSYFSFKDPQFSRRAYIYVWYDVSWLPGYMGFYLTAVSAFYTWLCSPTRKCTRFFICRPIFLNTVFLAIPALVTISCTAFAVLIADRMHKFLVAYDNFRFIFRAAAVVSGQHMGNLTTPAIRSGSGNILDTAEAYENIGLATIALMKIFKYSSMNWILAGSFLGLFYLMAVIVLITMIFSSFQEAKCGERWLNEKMLAIEFEKLSSPHKKRLTSLGRRRNSIKEKTDLDKSDSSLQKIFIPLSQNHLELRKGYSYLLKHCSLMILGLLFDIGVGFHLMLTVEQLGNPIIRSVNALLCCVDVIAISPAMLFQTWRIFTEKDVTQLYPEVASDRAQKGGENRSQGPISLDCEDIEEVKFPVWESCTHRRSASTTPVLPA